MTLKADPAKLAEQSFNVIDHAATLTRYDITVDGAAIVVDGGGYAPSTRACPNGEYVFQNGTDDEWEEFQDELDSLVDAYAEHGYSLAWEDGCLWLYGPQHIPDER